MRVQEVEVQGEATANGVSNHNEDAEVEKDCAMDEKAGLLCPGCFYPPVLSSTQELTRIDLLWEHRRLTTTET
jgi:hypothetical protein